MGGQRSYEILGRARSGYATGRGETLRPTAVWIDAETLLVRTLLEETSPRLPAGTVQRSTTTFEPRANPDLSDSVFQFVVPQGAR